MRDNAFLEEKLKFYLEGAFADVERPNEIKIAFGRKAKRRFGSIKMDRDKKVSRITINGLFRDAELIPEQIICATLVHELSHYAHGFCSPLKQKYKHPHQGGVIKKELVARELVDLYQFEKKWTKANWNEIVKQKFPAPVRRISSKRRGVRVRRKVQRRRAPKTLGEVLVDLLF
jgi:hypothetical protein